MRHPGYKHTEITKKKLSFKAKLRGNSGWLGRKHRPETVAKMSVSAIKRWNKNKPQWYIKPVNNKLEVVKPQVYEPYQDIYMEEGWEGIKDLL